MKWISKFIILFSLGIFVTPTAPANAWQGLPNRNAGQDWATHGYNAGAKKQAKPVKTTKQPTK